MDQRMTTGQVIEQARQRGFPAQQLFVIFTTPVDGWGPVRGKIDAHLAHQLALEREGVMFGAGPLCTEDGLYCDGEGMIIVRAASMEEARKIADRDPMHSAGARTYRIRPWILNEGAISLTVRLSNLKAQIA
jgi:uncharacterized protein YciI